MKTELFQEKTEIGGGAETTIPTAKERAEEVERRVRELVEKGEFMLRPGFDYRLDFPDHCVGCAIGALSRSLGCPRTTASDYRHVIMERGLASVEESTQLELGFENLRQEATYLFSRRNGDIYRVSPCPGDPFYEAGVRLRALVEP